MTITENRIEEIQSAIDHRVQNIMWVKSSVTPHMGGWLIRPVYRILITVGRWDNIPHVNVELINDPKKYFASGYRSDPSFPLNASFDGTSFEDWLDEQVMPCLYKTIEECLSPT